MNQRELDRLIDEGADGVDVGYLHPMGWMEPHDPIGDQAEVLRARETVVCGCARFRHPNYRSMARCAYPTAWVNGNGRFAWVEMHEDGPDRVFLRETKRALYLTISRRAMFARDLPTSAWHVELRQGYVRG